MCGLHSFAKIPPEIQIFEVCDSCPTHFLAQFLSGNFMKESLLITCIDHNLFLSYILFQPKEPRAKNMGKKRKVSKCKCNFKMMHGRTRRIGCRLI